mgnify:CR=1 FL=1
MTVMLGHILIARMVDDGPVLGMMEDSDLTVIDHDFLSRRSEVFPSVLVTSQKVFELLTERELDVETPTVTEHDDKEGKRSFGSSDGHGSKTGPIHLSGLSRLELQRHEGPRFFGANFRHEGSEDGVLAFIPQLTELGEDLSGAVMIGVQPMNDLTFEGIQFARTLWFCRLVVLRTHQPTADRLNVEAKLSSDLCGF